MNSGTTGGLGATFLKRHMSRSTTSPVRGPGDPVAVGDAW